MLPLCVFSHNRAWRVPWRIAAVVLCLRSAAHAAPVTAIAPAAPSASHPAVTTLTLNDALAFAMEHHPRLREADARVRASEADTEVPRAQWLPRVGAVAEVFLGTANNSTASFLSTSFVTLPRIGATTTNAPITAESFVPYPSSVIGVGITQEVFDFGRVSTQVEAARSITDAERVRSQVDRLDVVLAVRESYLAVLVSHAYVRAAEGAFQRAQAHRDFVAASVQGGLRAPVDLARAEADLAQYDVNRLQARARLTSAQHLLANTIGTTDAVDAAGDMESQPALPPLLEVIDRAGQRDPALLELAARLHAQQANTRAVRAQMRPDLVLTGAVSGRAGGAPPSSAGANALPGVGLLPVVPNYDVGLVLNVPLFDGVVNARVSASVARENVLRAQANTARQRVIAQIEQAYLQVQAAQLMLPALTRALDAARTSYEQSQSRFRAGLASSVELADAEALRTDAEIKLAQGQFAVAIALAQFDRFLAGAP